MAKSTFRRLATTDPGAFTLSATFVIAGFFFLVGSILFWPGLPYPEVCETGGAWLFIIGSFMYFMGAAIDYVLIGKELAHGKHSLPDNMRTPRTSSPGAMVELSDLSRQEPGTPTFRLRYSNVGPNQDAPPEVMMDVPLGDEETETAHEASDEELRQMAEGERHTILYRRFIVKCQKLNALIYAFGAFIFILGSIFFLPQAEGYVPNKGIHGCWLFLSGSAVYVTGAYLGVKTAQELKITNPPHEYSIPAGTARTRHMWWLTDEQITMASCWMYIAGAVLFVIGTAAFFPSEGETSWRVGSFFFVIGSVMFTAGAVLDYLRLERSHFENSIGEHPQTYGATPRESPTLSSTPEVHADEAAGPAVIAGAVPEEAITEPTGGI